MRTLLVVTGASRGLGRAFSVAFLNPATATASRDAKSNSVSKLCAILIARSQEGLDETERMMQQRAQATNVPLHVYKHSLDLGNLDTLDRGLDRVFSSVREESYDCAVLINNAGDLGHVGLTTDVPSLHQLRHSIDFNVVSSIWLSTRFARQFGIHSPSSSSSSSHSPVCTIVNVSSLCAVHPFPTMSQYCTAKSAKDMFHQVMAQELGTKSSEVRILNYAPGPCDTDMQHVLRTSDTYDKELQASFIQSKEEGTLVLPEDSAARLVELVLGGNFKDGQHVDYYDVATLDKQEEGGESTS